MRVKSVLETVWAGWQAAGRLDGGHFVQLRLDIPHLIFRRLGDNLLAKFRVDGGQSPIAGQVEAPMHAGKSTRRVEVDLPGRLFRLTRRSWQRLRRNPEVLRACRK